MGVTAADLFFKQVDETPFLDPATNPDKARPARGSQARIKWLGGDSETGPWVYYIEHPEGAVVKPHKHHAPRIEYVLDGEIEFFEGRAAIDWHRGDTTIVGSRHGAGSLSYVPPGKVYAYRITAASKLLHVFFENPVGRTEHVEDDAGRVVEDPVDAVAGDKAGGAR